MRLEGNLAAAAALALLAACATEAPPEQQAGHIETGGVNPAVVKPEIGNAGEHVSTLSSTAVAANESIASEDELFEAVDLLLNERSASTETPDNEQLHGFRTDPQPRLLTDDAPIVAETVNEEELPPALSSLTDTVQESAQPQNDPESTETMLAGLGDQGTDRGYDLLSDEQDFEAVAERETVESDAERIRSQKADLTIYRPEDIPENIGTASVAQYALSTTHEVGSKIYSRFGSILTKRTLPKRCAAFSGDYEAQQAFLDAGGPDKDKLLLDPDGDGFACGWTPAVYRSMLN